MIEMQRNLVSRLGIELRFICLLRKLARPFYGVLNVTPTNVEVRLVDSPTDELIFVNLN